ncbi:MAG: glycosyltransferase family 4 protein [Desulfobacterales bacterium]|nr:glycosyltransferase family 4 protein [Desulfobacterales bacterium]
MSIDPISGGGTAQRTIQMTRYLCKAGIDASILTSDVGMNDELKKELYGIELKVLPCLISRFYIPRFNIKKLKKIIEDVDIVHMMNHWTVINSIIYILCKKMGKPYVVCPAGALPIFGRSKILKYIYNRMIGITIIKNASRHIAITAEEKVSFKDYGVDPKIVEVIPNGINSKELEDENDIKFRKIYSLNNNPFILFMGRLNLIKGPDLLLKAFAANRSKFPNFKLVFGGPDGGMLSNLKDFVCENKLKDSVHFIGYLGGKYKSWAYHSADLLVVPSRQEAMSIVAIEAGITGTPVLMTDVCGFDQVKEIGGGFIVKPTIESIKIGLEVLNDSENLKVMGERLKKFVIDNYTWDLVIKKYIKIFKDILEQKNL